MNKYRQDVTFNFASSLGAAFRNALSAGMSDKSRLQDAETAGERLTSLLKRMIELKQFDDETVIGVLISMMHQMGELSAVADYCQENGCTNIETAKSVYKHYAKSLKDGDLKQAKKNASVYNFYLKQAGGPEKHPTEAYLSMGEGAQ